MTTTFDSTHFTTAMSAARLLSDPWQWCYLPEALAATDSAALAAEFPSHLLVQRKEDAYATMSYQQSRGPLRIGSDNLSTRWRQFTEFLYSDRYTKLAEQLTGYRLADCVLDLTVYEYGSRDWLGAHLDKTNRRVVQIFYFTQGWKDGDGGCLGILRTRSDAEPHRRLPPRTGSSAVLCPSDGAWHQVEAVTSPHARRRSLVARFITSGTE
ncbi:2OG-Fe(II) oxygenase [Mycobacterium haemophilum DSM 44634]|uniref:2OG-Fe(II) oxygenase n=1 Tax=Mycobacterium haemophilum TaxID=29311 RepID=UPI000654CB7D|nr:2OG-Fe(II) oxygenase [Mycobacterium haemophilum]AKN17627.1 hypothetical protein B586_15250 [Mycobacterium haemophilum DSM 44634]MCV7341790.1 2OG-Fe(II) oxygenase [Mycobacterium haemophilum DSM 44634]